MAPPRYSAHCQLYMDQLFVVFRLPHLTSFNSAAKTLVEFYICGSCRTGCLPVTFGRCLYRLCGPLSRPADRQTRSPGRGQARLVRVSGHFCVYNQAGSTNLFDILRVVAVVSTGLASDLKSWRVS